jgi:hypothetical protein
MFRVYRFGPDHHDHIRVEVSLNVGAANFTFQETFEIKHHILDLADRIAVGLTSSLSRSLRESVRTTVFVCVTQGPRREERFCRTFDVSLLAVDEWIDDELSGVFLPSFVLPRDPIVPKVIATAQRYLMALSDDTAQGFDGYQSSEEAEDPAAALEPQIRAIWYALQHDYALRYINPPPTFTETSQRLRTPSDVLNGGRGTCIDLALVLAACFEYIGVQPVIFLLTGHAFVGYWTSEKARSTFFTFEDQLPETEDARKEAQESVLEQIRSAGENELPESEAAVPPVEWKFDVSRWKDILAAVERGDLAPLEATLLTNGGSFASAIEEGTGNLADESEFDSMLDVALARELNVTPLPLAAEEGA